MVVSRFFEVSNVKKVVFSGFPVFTKKTRWCFPALSLTKCSKKCYFPALSFNKAFKSLVFFSVDRAVNSKRVFCGLFYFREDKNKCFPVNIFKKADFSGKDLNKLPVFSGIFQNSKSKNWGVKTVKNGIIRRVVSMSVTLCSVSVLIY